MIPPYLLGCDPIAINKVLCWSKKKKIITKCKRGRNGNIEMLREFQ